MKNNSMRQVRNPLQLMILGFFWAVLAIFVVGCSQEPVVNVPDQKPQPEQRWVAKYDLPAGWAVHDYDDRQAYYAEAKGGLVGLTAGYVYGGQTAVTPKQARDERYEELVASCKQEPNQGLINCSKGFHKEDRQVGEIKVFLLQRYGELFNPDLLATEVYWEGIDEKQSMLILGDWEQAQPALDPVVRTLRYVLVQP